jgi:LacI family transcriptional regulator
VTELGVGLGRRERATMRDVAALAGVGIKTVSRVFNDVPTVAPDLVERVREAADKLGYRPNLTAASLRRADRRTHTIGLLLDDVSNPYSSAVHRAVEDFAREQNVFVLAASLDDDPKREQELVRRLVDRRVDGVIVMPVGRDHRYVVTEQQAGTAFVFVDRLATPLVADAVVTDNLAGAREGVTHLLATGRRRIAHLGDDLAIPTAEQRFLGYCQALAAAGIAVDPALVVHGLRRSEQACRATRELVLGQAPEGLFTSQNLVTIGAVEALHSSGRQHEIALVGFDDVPMAAALDPGITVVAQDPAALGRAAAGRLFDRMAGDTSAPTVKTIPTRLVVRGSGELVR